MPEKTSVGHQHSRMYTLAEANVAVDKIPEYFGDGIKLHMLFNFILNQHLFLAE